jgi:raffinose/stachyose/melibiose transport system permease protein
MSLRTRSASMPRGRSGGILGLLPFLTPAAIPYALFVIYPILYVIVLSMFRWDGISPNRDFVGFDNYVTLVNRDPIFWVALRNTLTWTFLSLTIPTTIGLGLALVLNQAFRGRTFFRALFYVPAVLGSISVALMWIWIYNPSLGVVNSILRALGLSGWIHPWLGDPNVALYAAFAPSAWQATGVAMIIFLAGLQGVSKELVDAARTDGAGRTAVFRHVTLPALDSTIVVVLALTVINSLKSFDLIYAMTYGGPANQSQLLGTWTYFTAFNSHKFGLGSAIAVVLLGITLAIVVPYMWWTSRRSAA